jgi:hypothetical protein
MIQRMQIWIAHGCVSLSFLKAGRCLGDDVGSAIIMMSSEQRERTGPKRIAPQCPALAVARLCYNRRNMLQVRRGYG